MANRNFRQEGNLSERIAVIRENNVRLENRHREIELDKRRAVETGSSIHPSQIKVTISCSENRLIRNGAYEGGNCRGKARQGHRPRGSGIGGSGLLGYNLSKSLSRIPHDMSCNSQPQFQHGRQRVGGGPGPNSRGFYARRGGTTNHFKCDFVRHVEIDRYSCRGGKPHRYGQNCNNRNYTGSRTGQQQTITPSKSMPSLESIMLRQNSRYSNNHQGRGAGSFYSQNLPPRFRRNSYKAISNGGGGGGASKSHPPPPPPFPPPSPSQPTSSQKLPSNYMPKEKNTSWVRGLVIRSKNPIKLNNGYGFGSTCRVAAVSTQCEHTKKSTLDSDSPFINPDEDDDDGYIDDNPLEDIDQFTLKIDMDGGFIVHDATICDPILSKPISSWIDEVKSEIDDSEGGSKDPVPESKTTSHSLRVFKSPGKDSFDIDGVIFSNSSLTTSGVSTMSSLDCRIVSDDFHIQRIQKSYSADQLVKVTKSHSRWQ